MTVRPAVVLVSPHSGYGVGGRLFAELLSREFEVREVGISEPHLTARVAAAVEEVSAAHPTGPPPALVGVSLGVGAALRFAAAHPGDIASLTLIAPWAHASPKMETVAALWRSLTGPDHGNDHRDAAHFGAYLALVSSRGWRDPSELRDDPGVLADLAALFGACLTVDAGADAGAVTAPTLVVAATLDEFADVAQGHQLFGAIADARLAEVDSGHAVLLERPLEVLHLVHTFLADPRRDPPGTRVVAVQP